MKTNDFVNKQVVIDGFYEMASNMDYLCTVSDYIEWLEQLSSIQPESQWIPCSERLPNGQTEVIVSCCDDSGDSKYNYTSCGWMTRDGEYWIVDNEINYYVNAWMPLPEPYRKDGD